MLESTSSAPRPSGNAERSALVADALRRSGDLPARVRLRVYGQSMLPALWPGDVVEIESCSLENIQPGEIVLAQREGRLFLHRFLAPCPPNGFLLRGDSMPGPDPQYFREALLGRLVGSADQGSSVSARRSAAGISREVVSRPGHGVLSLRSGTASCSETPQPRKAIGARISTHKRRRG